MEKKNYIVGIDVGSSNVVMVVGSKNESGKMVIDAIVSKPSKGVNAGVIENINQVSECLKATKAEIEEELGIRISEAYAGISGAFVRCGQVSDHVYVRDPQNGISQFDVDALFTRMKDVTAPETEIILERIPQCYVTNNGLQVKDPVGSFGNRLSATFNFILSEKTPLERVKMVFRLVGLQLAGTYANSMIMTDAVASEDEKMDGVAVVDIGGSTTDVAVYHGNVIRHIATIPMGASAINRDIHMHGVPERSVESLKKKYGSAIAEFVSEHKMIQIPSLGNKTKGVLRRNLAAIIEARLTDIAEFVKAEIKDSGYSSRLSYGIVLTGGSASIEHIDELFRRVTGFEVRIATAEYGLDDESRAQIESPAHTAAVALLLKGAGQGVCSVVSRPGGMPPTPPTPPTPPRPGGMPLTPPTPPTPPVDQDDDTAQMGEQQNDEEKTSKGKRTFGGWFKGVLNGVTEGINKTFETVGDDEEI